MPPASVNDPAFYEQLLENLHDGVYFVDRERTITYWNAGAARISGYPRERVMGQRCSDNILVHTNDEGVQLCLDGCPLSACMQDGQPQQADVFMKHADGHRVPVRVRVRPLRDDSGAITGAVETFTENFERLAAIERVRELERAASIDSVTAVGNRRYADCVLRQFLEEGAEFAAVLCDIDHFKAVNDRRGHAAGDAVLRMVAQTLAHNLRSQDFVARWGGDEFLALIRGCGAEEAVWLAHRCLHLIRSSSLDWHGSRLSATVSIGLAFADAGDTPTSVMRRADEALYRAKAQGRNRVSR